MTNIDKTFKAIEIKDYMGIPVIVLESESGDRRYLSEFRSYSFQISFSIDGNGDAGSSSVYTKLRSMFNMMTLDECYAFVYDTVYHILHRYQYNLEDRIPNTWYGPGDEIWGEWIKRTINWIREEGKDYR